VGGLVANKHDRRRGAGACSGGFPPPAGLPLFPGKSGKRRAAAGVPNSTTRKNPPPPPPATNNVREAASERGRALANRPCDNSVGNAANQLSVGGTDLAIGSLGIVVAIAHERAVSDRSGFCHSLRSQEHNPPCRGSGLTIKKIARRPKTCVSKFTLSPERSGDGRLNPLDRREDNPAPRHDARIRLSLSRRYLAVLRRALIASL